MSISSDNSKRSVTQVSDSAQTSPYDEEALCKKGQGIHLETKDSQYAKTQGIRTQAKAWQRLLQCNSSATAEAPAGDVDSLTLEEPSELSLVPEEGFDPYNNVSSAALRR